MSALLYLGKSATSGNLGVEHFQAFLDLSGESHICSFCISSPSSVRISGGTWHRSFQTYNSSCTLLDRSSLSAHISQHVGRHSHLSWCKRFFQACISKPGAQRSAITAFNSLAAQRHVYRRVLSLILSGQWKG